VDVARRVKGEGSVYQRASDGRWFYAVELGGYGTGKARDRRTVSARTLKELRPKMRALDEKIRAGIDADGSTTLDWWLHWWLAEIAPAKAKSPRTRETYRQYIDNWISPNIGNVRLDRLKPDHLRGLYRTMRNAGKSARTVEQVHAILSGALKVAENDGKIIRSPAKAVTLVKEDGGSHGRLTAEETHRVMTVLAGRPDRARWYAALLLGMRQGEALGLAWDDIDEAAGVIHVRHSLGRVRGQGLVLGPVKSQASRRVLPLLPEIRDGLRDVTRDGPLVWGPLDNKADWKAWQAVLAAANVPPRPLHAARATWASFAAEEGHNTKLIAEVLGHARVTTTEDSYIHSEIAAREELVSSVAQRMLEG
jgi:integrase